MTQAELERIARVVHEALSAWSRANGEPGYAPWDEASDEDRASTEASVRHALANPGDDDPKQHDQWAGQKREAGWTFGPVKDPAKKTHPDLVPFDQLPKSVQQKDALLRAIVAALSGS